MAALRKRCNKEHFPAQMLPARPSAAAEQKLALELPSRIELETGAT
jgi:hypothetical protein